MVVQRRHEEDAPALAVFALRSLEPAHLHHDRQALYEEDAAQDGYQQLFPYHYGEDGDDPAEGEAAGVAHEDLRRVGVIPEEAHRGTGKGGGKDHQLADVR